MALPEQSAPRVLVVDDSPDIRQLITVNLELEGFEVRPASDGAEALEVLRAWRPDAMTLDVQMPGLDGFSTLERLRADPSYADLPVVMVTARTQSSDRERGSALGADGYLTKPFEPSELVSLVARLAREGRSSISE
jgi:CheY-like chemotaxis protein